MSERRHTRRQKFQVQLTKPMPFQVIVREIKSASTPGARALTPEEVAGVPVGTRGEQIYEQTVPELDLGKVIAAVNHKPRAPRKSRASASAAPAASK